MAAFNCTRVSTPAPTSPSILERIADLRQIAVVVVTDERALRDPQRIRTTLNDLDNGLQELAATIGRCPMSAEDIQMIQSFGRTLQAERERQGLSREDLAALAEMPSSELIEIEEGRRDPAVLRIIYLAIALNVDAGKLVSRAMQGVQP